MRMPISFHIDQWESAISGSLGGICRSRVHRTYALMLRGRSRCRFRSRGRRSRLVGSDPPYQSRLPLGVFQLFFERVCRCLRLWPHLCPKGLCMLLQASLASDRTHFQLSATSSCSQIWGHRTLWPNPKHHPAPRGNSRLRQYHLLPPKPIWALFCISKPYTWS